ncbi:MAG: triose-phosphate isomerase, partial [Vampirovibrionia bacterium]
MNINSLSFGKVMNPSNQKNPPIANNLQTLNQDTVSFEGKKDRQPLIAGNWKMHQNMAQSTDFITKFADAVKQMAPAKGNLPSPAVLIAPPFTTIATLMGKVKDLGISNLVKVGAQN